MAAPALAIGRALYLFLPLLVAAALAGVVMRFDWLRVLARPIDGGAVWRGRRVLGDGKTWRGVFVAIVGCASTAVAQKLAIAGRAGELAVVDYGTIEPLSFGAAMGAGAMLGELPNSFVKRRLGVPRGATARGPTGLLFYIWDQVDLLTMAWPAITPWVVPSGALIAASFLLALVVHPLVALVGYLIGARETPR